MPLLSGLSTGVKHGTRLSATAISMVLWAAKIEPLSDSHCTGCGAADRTEALLGAADHHVADHLAGDAGGRCHPADDFAIMAIEGKGDAHDLAIPGEKLQRIRAPAAVRADRCHLAIVFAHPPASGMAFEQEALLLHQPIDALGVDRGHTVGSSLAL